MCYAYLVNRIFRPKARNIEAEIFLRYSVTTFKEAGTFHMIHRNKYYPKRGDDMASQNLDGNDDFHRKVHQC